jgi:hypothetical protein
MSDDARELRSADIGRIMQLLPHRYPFLLVDRIIDMHEDQSCIGIKNVTINEPFFQGHFPAQPVMPGVLLIEAMAQTAGALAGVELARAADALGRGLRSFPSTGRSSRRCGPRRTAREHGGREAHRPQGDARIEVDVRVELLLDEILVLQRDLLSSIAT